MTKNITAQDVPIAVNNRRLSVIVFSLFFSWLLLFIVIWIIPYPKQYKKLIKGTTKKMLQEGDNSSIFGKKTLIIDEKNIEVIGEHTTGKILKESINSVKVYDDMVLIYLSGVTAQIIPTRYLNEESKKILMDELNIFSC